MGDAQRRSGWGRRGLTAVVVMAASGVGCGSDSEHVGQPPSTVPAVTVIGAMKAQRPLVYGPGTPLADGFVVERGTWRIGAIEPLGVPSSYNGVPIPDDGWKVELAVNADPDAVLRAYTDQAIRHGYRFRVLGRAVLHPGHAPEQIKEQVCHTYPSLHRIECSLGMMSVSRRAGHGLRMNYIRQAPDPATDVVGTHLTITVNRPRPVPPTYTPGPETGPLTRTVPRIHAESWTPAPIPMGPLTTVGQPIFRRRSEWIKALRIEPGSELMASPWPIKANEPSYGLLLRISGDPDEVAQRYAHQVGRFMQDKTVPMVSVGKAGGRGARLLTFDAGNAGGDYYHLTIADRGPGDRWGWFETNYD